MSLEHSLKAMDNGTFGELLANEQQTKRLFRDAFEALFREVVAPLADERFLYGSGEREPLGILIAKPESSKNVLA